MGWLLLFDGLRPSGAISRVLFYNNLMVYDHQIPKSLSIQQKQTDNYNQKDLRRRSNYCRTRDYNKKKTLVEGRIIEGSNKKINPMQKLLFFLYLFKPLQLLYSHAV